MSHYDNEVSKGNRFEFGKNWRKFLSKLNDDQIIAAESSLQQILGNKSLAGKKFLDIGSGSGLFSFVAVRLGAEVHSFDYDPVSVECTNYLKKQYFSQATNWVIEEGSVLDRNYITSLGQFDVVYSWGVLHHTGKMWQAISYAGLPVLPGGQLVIAIYNHHWTSIIWKAIKIIYNKSPFWIKRLLVWVFIPISFVGAFITTRRNPLKGERGMEFKSDLIDWLGGYPYEYAKVKKIVNYIEKLGFQTIKVIPTVGWTGCNQFIFKKL